MAQAILAAFGEFLSALVEMLPRALLWLGVAWVVVFLALVPVLGAVKKHRRAHVLRVDERLRAWALGLRYRGQDVFGSERTALTWFFRFWTNFASAPSLSFWSAAIPIWLIAHGYHGGDLHRWLLPGFCFCGSMLMSNILKRIFKRARPRGCRVRLVTK